MCWYFLSSIISDNQSHEEVIKFADCFLRIDRYVDEVHIDIINTSLSVGRRSLAAARAETCRRAFNDDLGVALEGEMKRLIDSVASQRFDRCSNFR
jgi:hypothetical protein